MAVFSVPLLVKVNVILTLSNNQRYCGWSVFIVTLRESALFADDNGVKKRKETKILIISIFDIFTLCTNVSMI